MSSGVSDKSKDYLHHFGQVAETHDVVLFKM